jgi:hypothetical protein
MSESMRLSSGSDGQCRKSIRENLLVASHCRKDVKLGHIHDVRSVYPKDNQSVLYWIEQGDLLFQNKEKSRLWLANAAPSN